MYHYTYLIQHKTKDKRYIGVRSSKCKPIEDTEYWGSSKHLPKDVKETHRKIILEEHSSRKEALKHEMLLHELNNVVVNASYYNKAKQTSTGFDTTGTILTDEHKMKCSKALKGKKKPKSHGFKVSKALKGKPKSEEHKRNCSIAQKKLASSSNYVSPRKGVKLSEEIKQKIKDTKIRNKSNIGSRNPTFKPWFITYNNVTKLFYGTTKEEQALMDGYPKSAYYDLCTRSKGIYPMKRGRFKGLIAGNIPV